MKISSDVGQITYSLLDCFKNADLYVSETERNHWGILSKSDMIHFEQRIMLVTVLLDYSGVTTNAETSQNAIIFSILAKDIGGLAQGDSDIT